MEAGEKPAVGAVVFVDTDGEDGNIWTIVMELHEGRCLLDAGWALAPPEVQENNFAAVIGKADGVFAVADGEVRRYAVGVSWGCAAVAGCRQGEHQQRADGDVTRKPHISIIRSGGDRKEGWVK